MYMWSPYLNTHCNKCKSISIVSKIWPKLFLNRLLFIQLNHPLYFIVIKRTKKFLFLETYKQTRKYNFLLSKLTVLTALIGLGGLYLKARYYLVKIGLNNILCFIKEIEGYAELSITGLNQNLSLKFSTSFVNKDINISRHVCDPKR